MHVLAPAGAPLLLTCCSELTKLHNATPQQTHHREQIVLATNIAETAITVDDVVFVLDTGRHKEKSYDAYTACSTLQARRDSQCDAIRSMETPVAAACAWWQVCGDAMKITC